MDQIFGRNFRAMQIFFHLKCVPNKSFSLDDHGGECLVHGWMEVLVVVRRRRRVRVRRRGQTHDPFQGNRHYLGMRTY